MRELSVGNNLTAGVKTTVYTVPTGYYAKWNLCYITNTGGNNKFIDVDWYDKSLNTEIHILNDTVISPGQYIKLDSAYIVLEEGDEIRATSEAASTMSIINTVELIRKA